MMPVSTQLRPLSPVEKRFATSALAVGLGVCAALGPHPASPVPTARGEQATALPSGTPPVGPGEASCEVGVAQDLVTVSANIWKAQTFTARQTGWLASVSLPGVNEGGLTTLHLRLAECGGAPGGEDLASTKINRGTRFDFVPLPLITAGQRYALVLSNASGAGAYRWRYSNSPECYADGQPFTSLNGGQEWSGDIVDFFFATTLRLNTGAGTGTLLRPPPRPRRGRRTPIPPIVLVAP